MTPSTRTLLFALLIPLVSITYLSHVESPKSTFAQAPGDELVQGIAIADALDLDCLRSMLDAQSLRDAISAQLLVGPCTHLGFERTSQSPENNRAFETSLFFETTDQFIHGDYNHDHVSNPEPTVPPDSLSYTLVSDPDFSGEKIVLPDTLSFDYLRHVLNNPPQEVLDELSDKTLEDLWVERTTSVTADELRLRLVYKHDLTMKTVTVLALHLGNGQFGPLSVE